MDYNSGLYHALSPIEYITRYNNFTKKSTDPIQLKDAKSKLEMVDAMNKKLKET